MSNIANDEFYHQKIIDQTDYYRKELSRSITDLQIYILSHMKFIHKENDSSCFEIDISIFNLSFLYSNGKKQTKIEKLCFSDGFHTTNTMELRNLAVAFFADEIIKLVLMPININYL